MQHFSQNQLIHFLTLHAAPCPHLCPVSPGKSALGTYDKPFSAFVHDVRKEGRYRVFADLERKAGKFPEASMTQADGARQDVISWCSNDYMGMGQHPTVMDAMKMVVDKSGVGAGGTRNISVRSVREMRVQPNILRWS